jgi:hypothetical protein
MWRWSYFAAAAVSISKVKNETFLPGGCNKYTAPRL